MNTKICKMVNCSVLLALCLLGSVSEGKVFSKCDLANILVKSGIHRSLIPNWICLIQHESSFNSRALSPPNGDGSRDYGLFQINNRYWCAPPGPHNDCGMTCTALINDNIVDDIRCAKKIYARHGFSAWYAWSSKCRGKNLGSYVSGCKY